MFDNNNPRVGTVGHFVDDRGSMSVLYEGEAFSTKIVKMTSSFKGVLRGFHYQCKPHLQRKVIVVVEGKIQDVCLEMNNDIPTGKTVENIIEAGSENSVLFIPENWAHAYLTLSESSKVIYLCDEEYGNEISLNPLKNFSNWTMSAEKLLISKKDLTDV